MNLIYVPDIENYQCYVVQSENVLRAYKTVPKNNQTVEYRDFYINSNYIYRDGSQNFSQYATLPICLENSKISSHYWYRNDFDSILIIFIILAIVVVYFPLRLVFRMFKRFSI